MKYNKTTDQAILYGGEINVAFKAFGFGALSSNEFGPDETLELSYAETLQVVRYADTFSRERRLSDPNAEQMCEFADNLGAIMLRGHYMPHLIDLEVFGPEDLALPTEAEVLALPVVAVAEMPALVS